MQPNQYSEYAQSHDNNDKCISEERPRSNSIGSLLCVPRNSAIEQHFYNINKSDGIPSPFSAKQRSLKYMERPESFAHALSERLKVPWIEQVFLKRECIKFIPTKQPDRCGCGRCKASHTPSAVSRFASTIVEDPKCFTSNESTTKMGLQCWNVDEHTRTSFTDAFGTIEFSGGTHAHKAHYVRLGHDSDPADIMYLMEKVWGLEPPRLVMTIHGGITNFEVQDRLGRVFRQGLLKAAQTTGAWIITAGLDAGVVRHVATALDEAGISARMRSKIVTIGIAPWGLLKNRDNLIGKDVVVPYDQDTYSSKGKYLALNDRHSYFLLVDNGTCGRYGADIILRKRFEGFLAQKQTLGLGARHVPVVCAVLEGGTSTLRAVSEYLNSERPVPVIVCDGSGRVSDLLAFAHRYMQPDKTLPNEVYEQMLALVTKVFHHSTMSSKEILDEILNCAKHRDLLTIYRLGDGQTQDVDRAILTAILKDQNLSPSDQLALTLAWNRVDIARSDIFTEGRQWAVHSLHTAMMEALVLDRVDFVKLFLEKGVSMKKFLTIGRLEQLYNIEHDFVARLLKNSSSKLYSRITLPEIGVAIERLIGNAYKCGYTSRKFKNIYEKYRKTALVNNFHIHIMILCYGLY